VHVSTSRAISGRPYTKEGMLFWPKILKRLEMIKSVCLKFAAASAALAKSLPRSARMDEGGVAEGEDGIGRAEFSRYGPLHIAVTSSIALSPLVSEIE